MPEGTVTQTLTFRIAFDVPLENVQNLINAALAPESGPYGAGHWAVLVSESEGQIGAGGSMKFRAEPDGEPYTHTNGLSEFVLDSSTMQTGMAALATKYPHAFALWMQDGIGDAPTGDLFLQCCLFGEEVFA